MYKYLFLGLYGNDEKYSCSNKGSNSVRWNDKVCEATLSTVGFFVFVMLLGLEIEKNDLPNEIFFGS